MAQEFSDTPLAALAASGMSPLDDEDMVDEGSSPIQQILLSKFQQMDPKREAIQAKRDALMGAYDKLIQAQKFRSLPMRDMPMMAAGSAGLMESQDPNMKAFGAGELARMKAQLAQYQMQNEATDNVAKTGLAASNADLGFLNEDQKGSLDVLKDIGTLQSKEEMAKLRLAMFGLGKKIIIKDQNGNPIGVFDKTAGTITPLGGGGGSATDGGLPPIRIPGIAPNHPASTGVTNILDSNGIDISSPTAFNLTRPEVAQNAKDAASARDMLVGANNAAKIAGRAEKIIKEGYAGGMLGSVESGVNAILPASAQFQGAANRDELNKLNKDIATSLGASMKNARLGIGMDKFLSGTTFSPDISVDANKMIVTNIKEMPYVAQRNMELENLTNKLPQAHKDAIYGEFIKDNPPFLTNDKTGAVALNPAYKDKDLIKKWFATKSVATPAAVESSDLPELPALPEGISIPKTAADYNNLTSGTQYYNIHTKSVKVKP